MAPNSRSKKTSLNQERGVPLTVSKRDLIQRGSDRTFRRFVHGLLAFTARLHAVRDRLAELIGLTGTQYTILISIAHLEQEDEINISTLAEHLHISGALVTIETGHLVRKGLVRKHASARDRRRVCLSVTREGRNLLKELAPTQMQANDLLFDALKKHDLERILDLLEPMIAGGNAATTLLDYSIAQRKLTNVDAA